MKDYVDLLDASEGLMESTLMVRLWRIEKIWKQTDLLNLMPEYLVLEPCPAQSFSRWDHCEE